MMGLPAAVLSLRGHVLDANALFQDLMPGQAGSATTLYTNTTRVGWIIAGSMAGVVAEIWNYHTVFWIALLMCTLTIGCLARIKDV